MKKLIIDRFEGEYAVCETENKSLINIPKLLLPTGIKEGSCLIQQGDGIFYLDENSKLTREQKLRQKMDHLFE